MTPRSRRLPCAAALLLALACDSGFDINATVEIPDDIAEAYSETNRGVLLVKFRPDGFSPTLHEVAVICGDGGTFPVRGSGDGTVPDTSVRAWIEPVTGRPCGRLGGYAIEDGGQVIDEDEPQASAMIAAPGGCAAHEADTELVLALP